MRSSSTAARRAPRAAATSDGGEQRGLRDRRRARVPGEFPPLDPARVKVVVHVDGGARGNPGPAAAAAVITDARRRGARRGDRCSAPRPTTSPNTAGLLLGLERARALGAGEVEVVNDSELVAKQVNGNYKVKHPDMRPLYAEALAALRGFERWSIRSVPRAQNADADALVNQALDAAR